MKINAGRLLLCIGLCLAVGFGTSYFVAGSIESWYAGLVKPAITPPSWAFAPIWTTLYVLMGISLYAVWNKMKKKSARLPIYLFLIQLTLNGLWSFLFFGLRSPLLGMIGIVALWIAIALTILSFHKISRTAQILLAPYIVWVSIAMLLNYQILVLN